MTGDRIVEREKESAKTTFWGKPVIRSHGKEQQPVTWARNQETRAVFKPKEEIISHIKEWWILQIFLKFE